MCGKNRKHHLTAHTLSRAFEMSIFLLICQILSVCRCAKQLPLLFQPVTFTVTVTVAIAVDSCQLPCTLTNVENYENNNIIATVSRIYFCYLHVSHALNATTYKMWAKFLFSNSTLPRLPILSSQVYFWFEAAHKNHSVFLVEPFGQHRSCVVFYVKPFTSFTLEEHTERNTPAFYSFGIMVFQIFMPSETNCLR